MNNCTHFKVQINTEKQKYLHTYMEESFESNITNMHLRGKCEWLSKTSHSQ